MTGKELKSRRESLRLDQKEFAKRLGLSISTLVGREQLNDVNIPDSKLLVSAIRQIELEEAKKKLRKINE